MSPADIRSHLRPFEPFRIVTSSGENFDVRSPELILIGLGSIIVGIPPQPGGRFFEQTVQVPLQHIVRIEPCLL